MVARDCWLDWLSGNLPSLTLALRPSADEGRGLSRSFFPAIIIIISNMLLVIDRGSNYASFGDSVNAFNFLCRSILEVLFLNIKIVLIGY